MLQRIERKIPPAVITALFVALMWMAARFVPMLDLAVKLRPVIVGALALVGGFFGVAGIIAFRRAGTTIHPMRPDSTSRLVVRGVYRTSRNPMYLGLFFALAAWSLWIANMAAVAMLPLFVIVLTRLQIIPEERLLRTRFGDLYTDYERDVRRWL